MNRINWIDQLKGFILTLVCLAHTNINIPFWGGNLIVIMSAIRMPTFFFLSGILFSTRRYPNISSYVTHKTKVLLIPYILLSLLFSFLDPRLYDLSKLEKQSYLTPLLSSSDVHSNLNFLAMEFVSIFYYGNPPNIVAPLWFVLTLYLVSILFFIIHHILRGSSRGIIIYAICCLMAGWILNLYELIFPYCFSTVLTASFFFSLGYLAKIIIKYMTELGDIKLGSIIIFFSLVYLYAINMNGIIDLNFNKLGNSLVYYIISTISGIFLIVSIFILLNRFVNKSMLQGILKNIARNALVILAVHNWIIKCCRIYFYSISKESYFPYLITLIMIIVTILAIPLFRTKLYKLIGKEKITFKESLSIK